MPYMWIYKNKEGGLWHIRDRCDQLKKNEDWQEMKIGNTGRPDPKAEECCPICFPWTAIKLKNQNDKTRENQSTP